MPRIKDFSQGRTAAALKRPEPEKTDVLDPVLEPNQEQDDVVQHDTGDENDASVALQKQIDALRKSEQAQKERAEQAILDREAALKRANERDTEIHSLKKTTAESHLEAVSASLAAATAEAETAQYDLEKAFELGDFKGQANATNRLSRANTNIANLEHGKAELEAQAKVAAEVKVEAPQDQVASSGLPPRAQNYLREHPELLKNPRLNAKIQALHYDIIDEGHAAYSQEYFVSMDEHLGYREKPRTNSEQDEPEVEQPRTRSSMVSAPVSREVPTATVGDRPGRVTLTVAQKEAAKIAGISEKEYAEQVIKLRAEKLNGNYGGQQ